MSNLIIIFNKSGSIGFYKISEIRFNNSISFLEKYLNIQIGEEELFQNIHSWLIHGPYYWKWSSLALSNIPFGYLSGKEFRSPTRREEVERDQASKPC